MSVSAKAAVLRDRCVVVLTGTGRVKFLQAMVTNDIRRLTPNRPPLYAGMLTSQGKLLYDLFLVGEEDRILIDIAVAHVEDLLKRLTMFKLNVEVEFAEALPRLAVTAIWGPDAVAKLGLDPEYGTGTIALAGAGHMFVDPRMAALGARLIHPADYPIEAELARRGYAIAAASDYDACRLALGVADTAEIAGESCYPLEANFEMLHGVDFRKGCYIGQELTARMKLKGELRRRVLPVAGTADLPGIGTPVMAGGAELGRLIASSGAQGLALLRLDRLAEADQNEILAQDVPLSVNWPNWLPR